MKLTGEQLISGIFIVAGMVYMQVHSIALWQTMFEDGELWKAVVPSVLLELIALWSWFKAKFRKKAILEALGFLFVAIASSSVVAVTTTMNVSFDVTVDQEDIKRANTIIKRNEATLIVQRIALAKASKWGNHPAEKKAQKAISVAEAKIEKAEKVKESKDTDVRLEMKSWIMAITNLIILIIQIICAHTIRPKEKKKTTTDTEQKPNQGGNNEKVITEHIVEVPEQSKGQQQNTPEQLKAIDLLSRLEALRSKFNMEPIGTILSTRVERGIEDGEMKYWNRNIKNKLDTVVLYSRGFIMEKLNNLEVGIKKLE